MRASTLFRFGIQTHGTLWYNVCKVIDLVAWMHVGSIHIYVSNELSEIHVDNAVLGHVYDPM